MLHLRTALLAAGTLLLTGCGAIFNGTSQTITATSAPDQAKITTSPGTGSYTTPASISFERKNSYTLTFERDGYKPAQFQINKQLQGGIVVLDVLFTGLIGVIIDAATGAWYKLSPESAVVSLTQIAEGPGPKTIDVYVRADGNDLRIESNVPGVEVQVDRVK